MIMSRTPLRVSFVGGGTDLQEFYEQDYGQVLSCTIDKYLYVTAKRQINIVEHKFRIGWSVSEFKDSIDEIEHPFVREALRFLKIDFPLEIMTFADVPARTGLGSSSSFAVGLLHVLFALKGQMVSKTKLAQIASEIEIDILKSNCGKQDQYGAACGGLNIYTFNRDQTVTVDPVFFLPDVKDKLESSLMLFYTAIKRDASSVLEKQRESTRDKFEVLKFMRDLVPQLAKVISDGKKLDTFGEILHEGWEAKRTLTSMVTSSVIDTYYEKARKAGALGGKLLGAGGGGFLLFYVRPENQNAVRAALSDLYQMPFKIDFTGSRISYYDPEPY